jgi:hypothetical protein
LFVWDADNDRSSAIEEATLDVHAPHEPIHGVKDFLLHLLTISVGLLIAVGIEGCVELHREHKLVKEARATMREEIESNSESMNGAVAKLDGEDKAIAQNIDVLTKLQRNPKDKQLQNTHLNADFSVTGLKDTAWKTAQTTGALALMPYSEAQRYASVYNEQQSFLAKQDKILEDYAQVIGIFRKFGQDDLTKEQASAMLERFGIWQAHLSYVVLAAKLTTANDKAFLEGKDGPTNMHTELGDGK